MKTHSLSRDLGVKGDEDNPKLKLIGPDGTSDTFQLSDFGECFCCLQKEWLAEIWPPLYGEITYMQIHS